MNKFRSDLTLSNMKAIYLVKKGKSASAFDIRETEIPEPKSDEVCIKVSHFGLNFADVMARQGLYEDAPPMPSVLGYDVAGTIHAIGADVSDFTPGDRVTALTRFGGYAEYACTNLHGVAKIPEHLDFASSTALTTQGCTAYYCMEECIRLHEGDRVLIQAAAGGVGTMFVQMAKAKGCIIYGTASTKKQTYLREMGVDFPIDYTTQDFAKEIKSTLADSPGIDAVFDSLGGATFKKAYKLLAPGGKIIFIGAANQLKNGKANLLNTLSLAKGFGIFSPIQLIMNSKGIIGVNMLRVADNRPHIFNKCLTNVIAYWNDGIIKPHIGKVFNAMEIADAHEYLGSRKSIGKVVCQW